MPDGLLHSLPPLDKSSGGITFAGKIKPAPMPKKPFSIPKMKAVAKLAEGMGKAVTGFTVNGDGGFTVTAATPGAEPKAGTAPGDADWWEKKVLGDGSA